MPCFILHTNEKVHEILRTGFGDSPLFTGLIHGRGPRYCPSIEDKLRVFPDNPAHQLFLEPEGRHTNEYYLQGFSSSLPLQVQLDALHAIAGLENVKIFRPAYAVEYDFFDPTQLRPSLESRLVENLFLAGQVNGTTGYEEAAAQGIVAGINAHRKVRELDPFILRRDQSYIGVLIDDLVTKGVDEPYRMFTSRAEYRILLRQDNADQRLTPLAHEIGLADEARYAATMEKYERVEELKSYCESKNLTARQANPYLESVGSSPISESKKIADLATRPEVSLGELLQLVPRGTYQQDVVENVEISLRYKGYIDRELLMAEKIRRLEDLKIPEDFDFERVAGLTIECRQKLKKYRPLTIAQASRISGVSPADISVLLVYFGR
jgi:tRNA uridine 5-carboxymethylaminomethyl modification enzyme